MLELVTMIRWNIMSICPYIDKAEEVMAEKKEPMAKRESKCREIYKGAHILLHSSLDGIAQLFRRFVSREYC